MNTWESGRESNLLDDIIAGRKTIEGRLNRDKFAKYEIGDEIWLRRDYRDEDGILHDGEPRVALVKIIDIRKYKSFLEMTTSEDFKTIVPSAESAEQAADEYNKYYSDNDQIKFGVLAIEIKFLK
ncbi:hypothetical protein CVV43_00365 [Candidatus Saccharibacteria bacterium HGW-Saccharibacteria-1]|jgi:ASC-1-like (ASCH) protein|nr:MAG: hypothetical protein CVV43_00365 [Candidatus Saccharibacteria bacterium HGW-Saccharibacteria-1]